MSKRTKVISFIAIILAIIIIFGVGIGMRRGWFAGLADVISGQEVTGNFKVTVKVAEGSPPNIIPLTNSARVYANSAATLKGDYGNDFGFASYHCTSGRKNFSADAGELKGETRLNSDRTSNLLEIRIDIYNGVDDYYIRVDSPSHNPRAQSCDFNVINLTNGAEMVGEGQVWKITNPANGGGYTAIFLYNQSGGGTQPAEKGKITGKILDNNDKVISDFGPNVFLIKNGVGTAVATPDSQTGEFTFDNLDAGKYTVRAEKLCYYNEVKREDIEVAVGSTNDIGILKLSPGGLGYGYGRISGAVLDAATGDPIKDVLVKVNAVNQDQTDVNGYYYICPVLAGDNLSITFERDDYQRKLLTDIELQSGEDKTLGIVKLEAIKVVSTFSIKGRAALYGKADLNFAGIEVFVMDAQTNSNIRREDGINFFDETDRLGSFEIKDVPVPSSPDDYYLSARESGYADALKRINYTGGAGGVLDVGDIILYPFDVERSIGGRVTKQDSTPLENATVYIERFDGKKDKVGVTDKDGYYKDNNLSAEYVGQEVRVYAEYVSDNKTFTAYHLPEWFTTTAGYNRDIDIRFSETIPKKRNVTVRVVDEAMVNIPNAAVAFVKIVDGRAENLSINAKTAENGDPAILVITEPLGQGEYGFEASADTYTHIIGKTYREDEIPEQETLELKRTNPLVIDYYFKFSQTPILEVNEPNPKKKAALIEKLKRVLKVILAGFPFDEKNLNQTYHFYKVNLGQIGDLGFVYDKTLWTIAHNFTTSDDCRKLLEKDGGEDRIKWFGPGFNAGEKNESYVYRATVTFQDKDIMERCREKLFVNPDKKRDDAPENLEFQINPIGMEGWIKYLSYRLGIKDFKDYGRGDNAYDIPVTFKFIPLDQEVTELAIITVEKMAKPNEYEVNSNIDASEGMIDRDIEGIKIQKDRSSDSGDTASTQTIKTVKAINGVLMFNLPAGKYRAVQNNGAYRLDERRNKFTIEPNSKITSLTFGVCYSQSARIKTYYSNLGLDILELGRWQLDSSRAIGTGAMGAKPALDAAKRGGLSAVVSLSDVSATSFYAKNGIKYCVESQDENYSGGIIAVSDSMLSKAKSTAEVSSLLSYQAGGIIYDNVLTDTNRSAWKRIAAAVDSLDNPENIYDLVFENSRLKNLDITIYEDMVENDQSLYSAALAIYKQNGIILGQRIDQTSNEEEKNILKAMVRHIGETAGFNPGDDNLYEPIDKISEVAYSNQVYKSGNWLKEKYQGLNTTQKIRIKYLGLLSNISQSNSMSYVKQQIQVFNNWLDKIRGLGDNGIVSGVVIENGQPVANALATINEKVAVTNKKGEFKIKKVQVGKHQISVKDRKSGKNYSLQNPNQQVVVQKNKESSIKIRVVSNN